MNRWMMGVLAGLALLTASAGLWVATVDVDLPRPTGPYAVGRMQGGFGVERHVAYTVYHPAVPGSGETGPYMPESIADPTGERDLGAFQRLPNAWSRIHHHAHDDAVWAAGSFPLVVFSPGADVQPQYYNSLLSELASNGFVVVALSHPGLTPHIAYPDGSTAENQDPPMPESEEAAMRQHEERIAKVADDIQAATIHLQSTSPIARHLNGRVGAFGHSLGGAGAASAAARSTTIQAVGDIDGSLGVEARSSRLQRPVFFMQDDGPVPPADEQARQAFVEGGTVQLKVTLHGATHTTFITDVNFFEETVPFMDGDTLGATESHRLIAKPIVDFFADALRA